MTSFQKRVRFLSLFLFFLYCFSFPTQSLQAQNVVTISPRVGPEIDAAERSYFGLFNDTPGFLKARAFAQGADSIRFDIDYALKKDGDIMQTNVVYHRDLVSTLSTFIEEFEQPESSLSDQSLKSLEQVVVFGNRYDPGQVTVFTTDGGMFDTSLLYASDSTLVLWMGEGDYDWRRSAELVVNMPLALVDRVEMPFPSNKRSKTTSGILVFTKASSILLASEFVFGGGVAIWGLGSLTQLFGADGQLGIYGDPTNYRQVISQLRGAGAFKSVLPPESVAWQTQPEHIDAPSSTWMEAPRRRHFSIGPILSINTSPFGLGYTDFEGYVATGFNLAESDSRVRGSRFSLGTSYSYDLNSRVAIGAQGVFAPRPKLKANTDFLYGISLGGFVEYSLKQFNPLTSTSRIGVVVGGGLDLNWIFASHQTDFSKQLLGLDPSLSQEKDRSSTSQKSIGPHLRFAVDHYLSSETSLRLQVTYNLIGIDIPGRKRDLQGGAYGTAYNFEPYTIQPIQISLGYRWHY